MKQLLENWRQFKTQALKEDVLNEISEESYERIKDWLADAGGKMNLPFKNLFGDKMRIAIPVGPVLNPKSDIGKFLNFFKENGWETDLSTGLAEKEVQTQKGTQVKKQKIGKVLQQAYRLKNRLLDSIESVRKVQDAILHGRTDQRAGPNWEELEDHPDMKAARQTHDKALEAFTKGFTQVGGTAEIKNLIDFWNKKSQFYRENPEKISTEYAIVVSRHPVDVLRMSDFAMIHSCHSEGSDYFKCAMSEAQGHGPVAYIVEAKALETVNLQEDEIFEDEDRDIDGIEPLSRIRLRKFFNTNNGYSLAVPEVRTYGASIPTFYEKLKEWALKAQETLFMGAIDSSNNKIDSTYMRQFVRTGGSYQDNTSASVFNRFFQEYDAAFTGDVRWEGDEEDDPQYVNEQLAQQYEELAADIEHTADQVLEHTYVSYEVMHEDLDEPPQLYFSGGITFEFELNGSEDWPREWRAQSPITDGIQNAINTHETWEDIDASFYDGTLEDRIMWDTGYYDPTPDGFDSFVEGLKHDDADYDEYFAAIKLVLVDHDLIEPTQIDILRKRIADGEIEFDNFEIEKAEEGGWRITDNVKEVLPVGTVRADLVRIFKAVNKDGFYTNGLAGSNKFSRQVVDQLAKEMAQAVEATKRQLKLSFSGQLELPLHVPVPKPQEVEKYVLNGFRLLMGFERTQRVPISGEEKPYGKLVPRAVGIEWIKFDLEDSMDATMINSAVNLIQHIDKNMDEFLEKVRGVIVNLDDAYMQIIKTGQKDFDALLGMAREVSSSKDSQVEARARGQSLIQKLSDGDVARIIIEKDWEGLSKRPDAQHIEILLKKVKEDYQQLSSKNSELTEATIRKAVQLALIKTQGAK
mgnify:FL=1